MPEMIMKARPLSGVTWERALDCFLLVKRAQGIAERTLDDYRYHVTLFFTRTRASMSDYAALKSAVLEYFASSASLSPATFNTRRKALKGFFSWTTSEGITPENPCSVIKGRKENENPKSIPEDILRRLLGLPDRTTFAGARDYGLILLSLDSGIRPKEALLLEVEDFNLKTLDVVIPASVAKTRISRTLPISPVTGEAIRRVINSRHPMWGTNVPVFCTEDGRPMTHNAWDRRLSVYSRKLGVKVRPYDLRHTFALMYLRQGGNAFSLQKILGHATLAMTKRYVALTQQDLKEQHSFASPLRTILQHGQRVRKLT